MAETPEGRVKRAIRAYLKSLGVWFFSPVSNGMGRHGIPDFICCVRGGFLAIEAKAPGRRGDTTTLQDDEIMAVHKAGGAAIVVDDVSQLARYFEEHFDADQT